MARIGLEKANVRKCLPREISKGDMLVVNENDTAYFYNKVTEVQHYACSSRDTHVTITDPANGPEKTRTLCLIKCAPQQVVQL